MMEKSFLERIQIFDENYPRIQEEIALAAEKAGRRPQDITLLAATKTVPLEVINHAIDSGLSAMGRTASKSFWRNMTACTGRSATSSSSASCKPTR